MSGARHPKPSSHHAALPALVPAQGPQVEPRPGPRRRAALCLLPALCSGLVLPLVWPSHARTPRQARQLHTARARASKPPVLSGTPQPQLYASCAGKCLLPGPGFSRGRGRGPCWEPQAAPPPGPAGRKAQAPRGTPASRAGRPFWPESFLQSRAGLCGVQTACGLPTRSARTRAWDGEFTGSFPMPCGGAGPPEAGWPLGVAPPGMGETAGEALGQQFQGRQQGWFSPRKEVTWVPGHRQGGRRWAEGRGSELAAAS